MDNTSTLNNAIAFAARGHAVFPVHGIVNGKCTCKADCGRNAGKHPFTDIAPHGFKNAVTDLDEIRRWFRDYPLLNYGVHTATLPTVDIDIKDGGDKSWRELVHKNYDIVGWRQRTGSGGTHIMLGTTGADLPDCKLAAGIDFKSAKGYIVGPGSLHKSGQRYIWDKSAVPGAGEMSPQGVPPWIAEIALTHKTKPKCDRTAVENDEFYNMLLEPALPGYRRERVSRLLGHLLGAAYPHRGVLACLVLSHVKLTYPDLTDFGEKEIVELARDLIGRDDKKRGVA